MAANRANFIPPQRSVYITYEGIQFTKNPEFSLEDRNIEHPSDVLRLLTILEAKEWADKTTLLDFVKAVCEHKGWSHCLIA